MVYNGWRMERGVDPKSVILLSCSSNLLKYVNHNKYKFKNKILINYPTFQKTLSCHQFNCYILLSARKNTHKIKWMKRCNSVTVVFVVDKKRRFRIFDTHAMHKHIYFCDSPMHIMYMAWLCLLGTIFLILWIV